MGSSTAGGKLNDRTFGFMFAAVFAVIAAIGWLGFDSRLDWSIVCAVGFLLSAIACPGLLLPLNRLWMWIAHRLGRINNYLLLGLFFYIVLLPAGMIARLFRRDPMNRKSNKAAESYWAPVGRKSNAETLRDMF